MTGLSDKNCALIERFRHDLVDEWAKWNPVTLGTLLDAARREGWHEGMADARDCMGAARGDKP